MATGQTRKISTLVVVLLVLLIIAMVVGAFLVGGLAGKLDISPLSKPINSSEQLIRSTLAKVRGREQNEKYFESALLELKMTVLPAMPKNAGDKVDFTPVGEGYLVASRGGQLDYVQLGWPGRAEVTSLKLVVPTEKERFLQESITEKHPRIPVQFGVKGLHAEQSQSGVAVYASYHYWKDAEDCAVFRIAKAELPAAQLTSATADWQVLYESTPCMKLDGKFNRLGEDDTFLQAGGRIIGYDDNRLLVSIGDHFLEGIHNTDYVQDPAASYGKLLLIDKSTGQAEVFSLGHRNPQGLTLDQYGNVWSTEHGPRGGDEVNLVEAGGNYGWPLASYGTLYAGFLYPEGKNWINHDGYDQPKFTWTPSVAPTSVVRLNDSKFKRWGDDLIITTLSGRSLFRLRLVDNNVVAVERIDVGDRLRDVLQAEDGSVLAMSDNGVFYKLEPAEEGGDTLGTAQAAQTAGNQGRVLWMTCAACHKVGRDQAHHIGPNLYKVLGRDIAAYDNFNYSPAMAALDGKWTEERMSEFLESPQQHVPGTTMAFPGIKDADDRQAVIDYLKQLSN